nr:MAG TPA: hypothetical protein [Caudoviricetes sp.]
MYHCSVNRFFACLISEIHNHNSSHQDLSVL